MREVKAALGDAYAPGSNIWLWLKSALMNGLILQGLWTLSFVGRLAGWILGLLTGSQSESAEPSLTALFLLGLLAKPKEQQALLGDATERFNENVVRFGTARANILLWSEVARSCCAFAWRLSRIPLLAIFAREMWGRLF